MEKTALFALGILARAYHGILKYLISRQCIVRVPKAKSQLSAEVRNEIYGALHELFKKHGVAQVDELMCEASEGLMLPTYREKP